MRPVFDLSFYLVLDPVLCGGMEGMVQTVLAAVDCGVNMVQLRDKKADTAHMINMAQALKSALANSGALLVINDDVDAAITVGADGLHIGQEDMPVTKAREQIGPNMLLGLSVETAELVAAVDPHLVDYVGIGPVFATTTKPDHKPPLGFDGLARLAALSPVPSVAIGGLKAVHAASVFSSKAQGMAVVSAICGMADPLARAHEVGQAIVSAREAHKGRT